MVVTQNPQVPGNAGNETRVLRSKLLNLILDWELEALALDARRYKSDMQEVREALKHESNIYRKCISEVSSLIAPANAVKEKE